MIRSQQETFMRFTKTALCAAIAAGLLAVAPVGAQAATCQVKAGQGTGSTDADAKFQAWEAVLQATDWGSWSAFMTSGMKIGSAPGYQVSGVKEKCVAGGGLGRQCTMQAKLCK
jgi:hypothetical protein